MKKKLLMLLFTMIFTLSSLGTTFASSEQTQPLPTYVSSSILIDGKSIDTNNYLIYTGEQTTTLYPLRLIAENLGDKITWDSSKKCVVIICARGEISLIPNSKKVTINGINKNLSYSIENKDSRIYVPLEFITEILGVRAQLDSATKSLSLQKPTGNLETLDLSNSQQKIQDTLAAYLTSFELNRNFSGQILVEQGDTLLIDRSYGYSDYENQVKAFNSTTFSIGSVTKQFTAAAIAQLAEKNKLAFNDPVSKYLSDVPFGDKITIHQLLTHTSGLYEFTNLANPALLKLTELTYTNLIATIKDKPLNFEPGTSWSYCNTNYLVLGAIVEKISGKTLLNYFQENIFVPADMKNTNISFDLEKKLVVANGYSGYMDVIPDTLDSVLLNIAYGAGYLCSTAEDLYKWDQALQAGKIVSAESLTKLFGKHADTKVLGHYGYGWFITTDTFGEEITHGGNTIGFTSLNTLFTEKDAHIIILTNKGYFDLESIKDDIATILNGGNASLFDERVSYEIPSSELSKYTGSFKSGDVVATIANNSGQLMLTVQGITCHLSAESKEKLYSRDIEIDLKYTFNAKGEATGIVLQAFGSSSTYEKVEDKKYISLSEVQMQKYAGNYEIKDILKFVVSVKEGKLIFQGEGQPAFEVMPFSETEFESLLYGVKITFNSKDTPTGLILYQAGQQFSATKLK